MKHQLTSQRRGRELSGPLIWTEGPAWERRPKERTKKPGRKRAANSSQNRREMIKCKLKR